MTLWGVCSDGAGGRETNLPRIMEPNPDIVIRLKPGQELPDAAAFPLALDGDQVSSVMLAHVLVADPEKKRSQFIWKAPALGEGRSRESRTPATYLGLFPALLVREVLVAIVTVG